MKSKFKKTLFSFLIFMIISASVFPSVSFAAAAPQVGGSSEVSRGTWYNPTHSQFLDKVSNAPENEIFGERYTFAQVNWIIHSLFYLLAGPIANCANEGSATAIGDCLKNALEANDTGVILPVAQAVDLFQDTKPVSGVDYVAGKLRKFNIVDNAYAQEGFGYTTSLAIIQPIWVGVRDASYSLVIFAILILAFMVMLRAKISPQAAVTVQSALPRVALGLVLITFSYAIAGFMVDIVFVLQGLVAGILNSSGLSGASAIDSFIAMNHIWKSTFAYAVSVLLMLLPYFALGGGAFGLGAASAISAGPLVLGVMVAAIILLVIIMIVFLVALIRIFWLQLKTSVAIMLLVIVSPLMMLVGIIRPGTIKTWFRSMAANLSVFFTISLLVMLAHLVLFSTRDTTIAGIDIAGVLKLNTFSIKYQNPPAGSGQLPTNFGVGGVGLFGLFLSFGMILSIPKMASMARDYISKPGPSPFENMNTMTAGAYGIAAGTMGAGVAGVKRGIGQAAVSNLEPGITVLANRLSRRGKGEGTRSRGVYDSSR